VGEAVALPAIDCGSLKNSACSRARWCNILRGGADGDAGSENEPCALAGCIPACRNTLPAVSYRLAVYRALAGAYS